MKGPWSYLTWDASDDERTEQTEGAHNDAATALHAEEGVLTGPVQIVIDEASGLLYALEIRGQSSATGHGKTGSHPRRLALLARLQEVGVPVRLAYKDGSQWREAWMEELGPAKSISDDPVRKRFGWWVRDMKKVARLTVPRRYQPEAPAQPRLGEE
jgi:hypothetical protein